MNGTDRPDDRREMRDRDLARAQKLAAGLTIIAVLTALVTLFGPEPGTPLLVLLAALPLLAIICAIGWRDLFRIGLGTGPAQANLAAACAVAACALFARTTLDLNLVSRTPLTAFGAAVGVVFLVTAVRREPQLRRRWWRLLAASVIIGAYAFGILGQINHWLDRTPQSVLRSRVLDKHSGHTRLTSSHVTLAPWGPFTAPTDATVPQPLYEQLDIDDPICVRLHDGALGMAWYTVTACR